MIVTCDTSFLTLRIISFIMFGWDMSHLGEHILFLSSETPGSWSLGKVARSSFKRCQPPWTLPCFLCAGNRITQEGSKTSKVAYHHPVTCVLCKTLSLYNVRKTHATTKCPAFQPQTLLGALCAHGALVGFGVFAGTFLLSMLLRQDLFSPFLPGEFLLSS